jgi:hypothetical protein
MNLYPPILRQEKRPTEANYSVTDSAGAKVEREVFPVQAPATLIFFCHMYVCLMVKKNYMVKLHIGFNLVNNPFG